MSWSSENAPVAPPWSAAVPRSTVSAWPIPATRYVSIIERPAALRNTLWVAVRNVSLTSAVSSIPSTLLHWSTDCCRSAGATVVSIEPWNATSRGYGPL